MILLEIRGLELYAHHGVFEHEKRDGQPFWFDVELDVPDTALSDRLEDAIDYRRVVELVRGVSDSRSFDLIEALAGAVAERLLELPVERVRVRVRKRPAGLPIEESAATVERYRSAAGHSPPARDDGLGR
jgi:dihydroneopterin aldolase